MWSCGKVILLMYWWDVCVKKFRYNICKKWLLLFVVRVICLNCVDEKIIVFFFFVFVVGMFFVGNGSGSIGVFVCLWNGCVDWL